MTALSKATVATKMHHGVIACEPDASLSTVARAMQSYGVHCVLVAGLASAGGDERFVWAIVTDADLLAAAASDGADKRAADVAQTEAPTIEPSATLAGAARTMAEHRVTHLVVVEPESEQPVGVVSSTDVLRTLALERP